MTAWKRKTFVSAVVYVRDDAEHLTGFLERLAGFLADGFDRAELIVVDDASGDGGADVARAAAAELPVPVTVVELARRHGIEAAATAGLERAVGDFVFEIEGVRPDYDLAFLGTLYDTAAGGYDVVSGTRGPGDWRSRLFYHVVNRYSQLGVELASESVRVVSRRALNATLSMREKVRYRKALYALTGYPHRRLRYDSLPGVPRVRRALDRETLGTAIDVVISFSEFGLRLARWLAVLFAGVSVVAGAFAITTYLLNNNVVAGWTTLMLFMSASFTVVFLVLALTGEYLQRALIELRGRPLYAVRAQTVTVPADEVAGDSVPRFIAAQAESAAAPAPTESAPSGEGAVR